MDGRRRPSAASRSLARSVSLSLSITACSLVSASCRHAPVFAPTVEAPEHCPGTTASPDSPDLPVKVLTINLRHDSDQWPRRFELVANEIARLDPDLIGLQELAISEDQGAYLDSLLEKRGHAKYEIITERKTGLAGSEGIGIMSRWPIEKHVSAAIGDERVAILARIRHPSGGLLDMANTHLDQHRGDDGEMNRDQETIKLLDLLAREDDCRPTILTGDLNSTDKGHAMSRLRSARFEDSWAKANPNAIGNTGMVKLETGAFDQHPRRRIDFILTRPAGTRTITPLSSEVVFKNHDGKGFYPSDHFGVFTVFSVRL